VYSEALKLVANLGVRRPAAVLPSRLDQLFQSLSARQCDAQRLEDQIWALWMHHPHRRAAQALERTAADIADQLYDVAETRLSRLLRARPDFPEAWNKRATLYYLQERDDECVHAIQRTLELEPRHFGALCGLAEILRGAGEMQSALFVFQAALRINPHLSAAREAVTELTGRPPEASH
jgi:tetratricopeptide (TPR) repeat protein